MSRLVFVGKCAECGVSLYYNKEEDKLVAGRGGDPECLHHYDWPEDREGEEEELQSIVLPLNYAKEEKKNESKS